MKKKILIALTVIVVVIGAVAAWGYSIAFNRYDGPEPVRIYVPAGWTEQQLRDMLTSSLGADYGGDVYMLFAHRGGKMDKVIGSYVINPGDRAWSVSNRLRTGTQAPVQLTFNNVRTLPELAKRIAEKFAWTPEQFLAAADTVLPTLGYDSREQYMAAFAPDSYEFYWTTTPDKVVRTIAGYRDKFWNDSRLHKAKELGLTPVQVATLASIVEEETAKTDERGKVARLYLNRLGEGMKLQADPTVKFAVGNFALKRIGGNMLNTPSPYNTYHVNGLPPGPIRIVENATIDAVLNAPKHSYLYMCAKSDFSGYHDFASDYNTHLANARRYQSELNRRGIH